MLWTLLSNIFSRFYHRDF